jgi:hypothetical protein
MKIEKRDAPLYLDVHCYVCERLMALSNANQYDGRYYCNKHLPINKEDTLIEIHV